MALKSPTVLLRFITLRQIYSARTQDATVAHITTSVLGPKIMTDAIKAGINAIITSSIIFLVFVFAPICGDEDTINLLFIAAPTFHYS